MIPEVGHFSLILALFVALTQALFPLWGASRGIRSWMNIAPSAAIVQFLLLSLSFFSLTWSYVTSDFSVYNVASNSHTDKPLLYKIAGVWGNHEGSMLLWVFILGFYGMTVAFFGRNLPSSLRTRALGIQGLISFGFILFILLTSNPFLRLDPVPLNGQGLNPILQDPGLAFHPPFLYLGYVGFSMAFSFAVAALLEGNVNAAWARWVRPWTLLAWCFLTFGIGMGSWWAYYTLGWGGWWYWDPVENASFMPWLAGTALLHSSLVVERRDTLKAWTLLLTIIAFSFSLLGTFLVRSGALTSVHSFANDPARGLFILVLLVLVTGGSLTLFALRAPALKSGGLFAPVSKEGSLLINNILLSTAAGTILIGTLYPLFLEVLDLGKISVGPPYYNSVFIPLMIPVVLLMSVGPLLNWRKSDGKKAWRELRPTALAAALVTFFTWLRDPHDPAIIWAAPSMGLAAWLFIGTGYVFVKRLQAPSHTRADLYSRLRALPRSFYGMIFAHAGLAIVILGIAASTAWKTERIQVLHIGESANVASYEFRFTRIEQNLRGPNYTFSRGHFLVTHNGQYITELFPEKRLYDRPHRPTTKAAIHTTLAGDLYAVLGDAIGEDKGGGYVTRLYFNPLVACIFVGAAIMATGGLISLTDRRYKIDLFRRSIHPESSES